MTTPSCLLQQQAQVASGRAHDQATLALALPLGLLVGLWHGPMLGLTAALAFALGGLWLSPDLDTRSRPTLRWGPLASLWWPYRQLVRHRGWLSHTPVLGTTSRLIYLTGVALVLLAIGQSIGGPHPGIVITGLEHLWGQQRPLLITALLAIEASAWLHLLQDGDPMPLPPSR